MSVVASYPILERIADELLTRLEFLTAGYDPLAPVVEVIRPPRLGGNWSPKNWQIVLTRESPERNPELDCPGSPPAIAWNVQFNIRCHLMQSEAKSSGSLVDDTPIETYQNIFAAVVQKIVQDETFIESAWPWHTMGNLAINAQWGNIEHIDASGGVDGLNVPLIVTYRTDEDNPFNKR